MKVVVKRLINNRKLLKKQKKNKTNNQKYNRISPVTHPPQSKSQNMSRRKYKPSFRTNPLILLRCYHCHYLNNIMTNGFYCRRIDKHNIQRHVNINMSKLFYYRDTKIYIKNYLYTYKSSLCLVSLWNGLSIIHFVRQLLPNRLSICSFM